MSNFNQPHRASKAARQNGFTLLELLVTLVVIGLMTAVVGFSVTGNSARTLKYEAEKLAARLNAAHAQMIAGASPMRLVTTPTGYAFEITERAEDGSAAARWKPLLDDETLAARTLPNGGALALPQGAPLPIAREPIAAAQSLTLSQGAAVFRVATDGVQGWAVQ